MSLKIILTESQLKKIMKKILTEDEVDKETESNFDSNEPKFHSLETMDDIDDNNQTDKTSNTENGSNLVLLLCGLEHRATDIPKDSQVALLKKNLTGGRKVIGFHHWESDSLLEELSKNPNAKVVLFSMGTGHTSKIANDIKNIKNLYVLEPYPKAKSSIEGAIKKNIPLDNIILGNSPGAGAGMFQGASKTPKGYSHFGSLEYIGGII